MGLRNVDVALLDKLVHLPIEERQQQRADVGAVDVGVRHDDDLVIAQLRDVEVVANAGAESADDVRHLFGRQHLVDARTLDVQDLTSDREHGLILALASLLCRTACRVTLDDEEFGVSGIAVLTFGEATRQPQAIERTLAAGEFAGLARGFTGERCLDDLADNRLCFFGMLFEPSRQLICDDAFDDGLYFGRDELVLRLARKLGVGHLDGEHARQAFTRVFTRKIDLLLLGDAAIGRVLVDDAREAARKPAKCVPPSR